MNTPPRIDLHLFFATQNDKALILRRARDREYNLIAWDRKTDTFVEGQWLRKYVEPGLCHLSPDGRYFMYCVRDASFTNAAINNYTVISQPPYFTALALFPQGPVFAAGGEFLDNTFFTIRGDGGTSDIVNRPTNLTRVFPGEVTKDCKSGYRLANGRPAPFGKQLRERLMRDEAAPQSTAVDDYITEGACLYRRKGMVLIRDFTDMPPRYFPAPYSSDPVEKAPWHPADSDGKGQS